MEDPPAWLQQQTTTTSPRNRELELLHPGEREAICLAHEVGADLIILDERKARGIAESLGLKVTGLIGILDQGAEQGLLDLERAVARLRGTNFRIHPQLLERLLQREL